MFDFNSYIVAIQEEILVVENILFSDASCLQLALKQFKEKKLYCSDSFLVNCK